MYLILVTDIKCAIGVLPALSVLLWLRSPASGAHFGHVT